MKPSLRAFLSWCAANFFGVFVTVACWQGLGFLHGAHGAPWDSLALALIVMFFGAALVTAPLSMMLVFAARLSKAPRPWADFVGGIAIGVIAPELMYFWHWLDTQMWVGYGLVGGMAAGPLYWRLAGKPRPPYAA